MKTNYHTHTYRCMHAAGTDEMYVKSAIRAGFDTLGFSDHSPWPYESSFVSGIRMGMAELPGYVGSLRRLKEDYKDKLNILIGLECEYFPKYLPWLKEAREEYHLDYLIFGAHYIGSDEDSPYVGYACRDNAFMRRYGDMCIEGIQSGLYAYLAHPDVYMRGRTVWDEDCLAVAKAICACALQYGMPLEYNLNAHVLRDGGSGFPCPSFWECAAETGNRVIIGYDAHEPALLENKKAEEDIRKYLSGLSLDILDSIQV